MNLSYLKYVVKVEKTGFITKAAQNFYMNQFYLSKVIRELEGNLGCSTFDHTSRGIVPTKRGEKFLRYVKAILAQEEQIGPLCVKNSKRALGISLSVPRATYISYAFIDYLKDMCSFLSVNLGYKKTSSWNTIRGVSSKSLDLGIIQYQTFYESYYMKMLQDENLDWGELWKFSYNALMSAGHLLVDREHLTCLDFADCMEVVRGDMQNPSSIFEIQDVSATGGNSRRTTSIYDRSSQFEILWQISGTHIWISLTPYSCLEATGLIQEPCSYPGNVYKDLLIYRSGYHFSRDENELLYCLARMISRLSIQQPMITP